MLALSWILSGMCSYLLGKFRVSSTNIVSFTVSFSQPLLKAFQSSSQHKQPWSPCVSSSIYMQPFLPNLYKLPPNCTYLLNKSQTFIWNAGVLYMYFVTEICRDCKRLWRRLILYWLIDWYWTIGVSTVNKYFIQNLQQII